MFNKGGREKEDILSSKEVHRQPNQLRVSVTTGAWEMYLHS